jgi:hypothetical protein
MVWSLRPIFQPHHHKFGVSVSKLAHFSTRPGLLRPLSYNRKITAVSTSFEDALPLFLSPFLHLHPESRTPLLTAPPESRDLQSITCPPRPPSPMA